MDPITMASSIVAAGSELSSTATLILTAAEWIYNRLTNTTPRPIKNGDGEHNQDRMRYDRLCNLRRRLTDNRAIPEQWELVNDCPVYQTTFNENASQLRKQVEDLRLCDYPQKLTVVGLVSNIEHLFKRLYDDPPGRVRRFLQPWHEYRADGYEAMFFGDLALWLSIVLPRYDIKKPGTAVLLRQWIDYCQSVQDEVLVYRSDENTPNNPKAKLNDIIAALHLLHANICKANKASSFNEKIQTINASILDMSKNVFDLLHLLLKGVQHREIQVAPFLRQAARVRTHIPDPAVQKLLDTQMGQWLVETFKRAGITSNSFENTLPIDVETIRLHISRDFSEMKNLKLTGLWGFARKDAAGKADRNVAIRNLTQISELHRLLLMLYYVRESVVLGALVSQELGDAWVYGEDTGRQIISVLLDVIADASQKLESAVTDFWQRFYGDYRATAGARRDDTDPCFRFLTEADRTVTQITGCHTSIHQTLHQIRCDAESYNPQALLIRDKERLLKQNLARYSLVTGLLIDPSFVIEAERDPAAMPRVISVVRYMAANDEMAELNLREELVLGYRKGTLPFYQQVQVLLNLNGMVEDPALAALCHCKLLPQPRNFSSGHRNIYRHFLMANHAVVNIPPSFSFFALLFNISFHKFPPLVELYRRVNAVMHLLYPVQNAPEAPRPTPLEVKLINTLLGNTIIQAFREHNFYTLTGIWQESCLEIHEEGDLVRITLNPEWAQFVSGALLQDVNNVLIRRFNEQVALFEALTARYNELQIVAASREEELVTLRAELAESRETSARDRAELIQIRSEQPGNSAELVAMRLELARTQRALQEMEARMAEMQANTRSERSDDISPKVKVPFRMFSKSSRGPKVEAAAAAAAASSSLNEGPGQ